MTTIILEIVIAATHPHVFADSFLAANTKRSEPFASISSSEFAAEKNVIKNARAACGNPSP
jgi:hypothetical protein